MKTTNGRTARDDDSWNDPKEVQHSKLRKLFEDELKDIYWAEKALTKAIPKMFKNASSGDLKSVLQNHLGETEEQVTRVERVFGAIGRDPKTKKCDAMAGLISEAEELMRNSDEGFMRDAAIISAAQKIKHYEIASYGTLRTFARTLALDDAVEFLETILHEEKTADEKLTELAEASINMEAAAEPEE